MISASSILFNPQAIQRQHHLAKRVISVSIVLWYVHCFSSGMFRLGYRVDAIIDPNIFRMLWYKSSCAIPSAISQVGPSQCFTVSVSLENSEKYRPLFPIIAFIPSLIFIRWREARSVAIGSKSRPPSCGPWEIWGPLESPKAPRQIRGGTDFCHPGWRVSTSDKDREIPEEARRSCCIFDPCFGRSSRGRIRCSQTSGANLQTLEWELLLLEQQRWVPRFRRCCFCCCERGKDSNANSYAGSAAAAAAVPKNWELNAWRGMPEAVRMQWMVTGWSSLEETGRLQYHDHS